MKNDGFTFRKRARSFKFAFNGIKLLITKEHNAWIHCFAAVCVLIAGVVFGLSRMEWIAVTIVIGAVLAAEAVNSSIEALADLVSPEYNEAIKRTKDLAAGAVIGAGSAYIFTRPFAKKHNLSISPVAGDGHYGVYASMTF